LCLSDGVSVHYFFFRGSARRSKQFMEGCPTIRTIISINRKKRVHHTNDRPQTDSSLRIQNQRMTTSYELSQTVRTIFSFIRLPDTNPRQKLRVSVGPRKIGRTLRLFPSRALLSVLLGTLYHWPVNHGSISRLGPKAESFEGRWEGGKNLDLLQEHHDCASSSAQRRLEATTHACTGSLPSSDVLGPRSSSV